MRNHPVVIKVGGALLDNPSATAILFQHINALSATRPVVLVHGGGPVVESLMAKLSLTSSKLNGLRITPDEHMPYVCGALAGTANKMLCAAAIAHKLTPVGLSLLDGNLVTCAGKAIEYGAVGSPAPGDSTLLKTLLVQDYLPIISSIGSDATGRLLNINADEAATVVAQLLQAELLLLSDVDGVMDATGQVLATLDHSHIEALVSSHTITDGMAVKTSAALQAATTLQRPVIIGSWQANLSSLLAHSGGTRVMPVAPTQEPPL
ncbi:acetylglutamate kinase [Salinimonas marina]|uniref:Acetylglutamate kinase n=1 Tax=Salinimonas marina TaxID=2785918 RepID=A0A7S9DWX9_9ALTE|nr:acetylglutamate kinase [Salinimonas marina]QPG05408.1 acetylglutamate kinase [Salinimonas marina]